MPTRSPLWISLGLFCAPLLLILLFSPLLTDWLARHLLESKSKELDEYKQERTRILDHHVPLQLERFAFDCGPEDMALLREPEYYNRHIRLAALQLADGTGCSTLGPAIPLPSDATLSTAPGLHFTSTARRPPPTSRPTAADATGAC